MKTILISAVALNAIAGATAAAKEVHDFQQTLVICDQFIIEESEPGALLHQLRDCGSFDRSLRNCHAGSGETMGLFDLESKCP